MSDAHQGELLPSPPPEPGALFLESLEFKTGEYTAERFEKNRPEDFKLVMYLLAKGHGPQFIEDWFRAEHKKLSKNTVKAVRKKMGETIDLLRERLAGEAFQAADDYREAALLILREIMASPARRGELTVRDVQSLEVASGIATQNAQLLSGQPTARVAIQDLRPPGHDDYNRMIAGLPAANVIEVSTHSVVEMPGQKAAPGAADGETAAGPSAGPGLPAVGTSGRAQTECESDGKGENPA
jgi:hypothetical protein